MKMPARREFFAKLGAIGGLFALAAPAHAQTPAQRRFIKTDRLFAGRSYPGRPHRVARRPNVASHRREREIACRRFRWAGTGAFAGLSQTLEEAGGKLSDIVTMTVFMVDDRFDLRFRKEIFKDNFPASALINIHSLVPPYAMIEIQCVAVIA